MPFAFLSSSLALRLHGRRYARWMAGTSEEGASEQGTSRRVVFKRTILMGRCKRQFCVLFLLIRPSWYLFVIRDHILYEYAIYTLKILDILYDSRAVCDMESSPSHHKTFQQQSLRNSNASLKPLHRTAPSSGGILNSPARYTCVSVGEDLMYSRYTSGVRPPFGILPNGCASRSLPSKNVPMRTYGFN